jgi:hypothetical protein
MKLTLLLAVGVLSVFNAWADTPTDLDFVSQQLATQKLNELKALSTPAIIKTQAEYFRKMYLALIKSGFSEEQALSIIVAMASKDEG